MFYSIAGDNPMKLLKVALDQGNYELAVHVLVYGLLKAKAIQNGKKGAPKATRTPESTASTARFLTRPTS
jgi:hypothetical protein